MNNLKYKIKRLKELLSSWKSLLVAFSGGTDSSFLLAFAKSIKNLKVEAVIVTSPVYPENETDFAISFCKERDINYHIIKEPDIKHIEKNPENRCYYCKMRLFSEAIKIAKKNNLNIVADGTNADDLLDYRPGLKALKRLKIRSPLAETGFTKEDIRVASKKMNLKTWDKPSLACLASRFPFGTKITNERLKMVSEAEEFLWKFKLSQVRVRWFEKNAIIEIKPEEFYIIIKNYKKIVERLKSVGFKRIMLDLEGYRTGSLNPERNKK